MELYPTEGDPLRSAPKDGDGACTPTNPKPTSPTKQHQNHLTPTHRPTIVTKPRNNPVLSLVPARSCGLDRSENAPYQRRQE